MRLISSARITLLKSGPSKKRKSRVPVARFSSITSVPVMSAGIRSGVNWMRLNVRFSVRASVLIISVFARPGTPSNMQWLRLKSEINSSSMTSRWPTITCDNCSTIFCRAALSFSMAALSWWVSSGMGVFSRWDFGWLEMSNMRAEGVYPRSAGIAKRHRYFQPTG